jgi:S1-C subfamily serine protease
VEIQGFSPKVTRGEISSLNGAGDDPRAWQISVPIQTGNSGGPLLDEFGNLIGIVVSKLGLKAAKVTGDLPQNVGYAIKSAYILPLIENSIGDRFALGAQERSKPSFEDMVAKAQEAVVVVLVY